MAVVAPVASGTRGGIPRCTAASSLRVAPRRRPPSEAVASDRKRASFRRHCAAVAPPPSSTSCPAIKQDENLTCVVTSTCTVRRSVYESALEVFAAFDEVFGERLTQHRVLFVVHARHAIAQLLLLGAVLLHANTTHISLHNALLTTLHARSGPCRRDVAVRSLPWIWLHGGLRRLPPWAAWAAVRSAGARECGAGEPPHARGQRAPEQTGNCAVTSHMCV